MNKWLKLVIAIVLCQAAGGVGSLFTTPKIGTWYADLIKPSFNPPNWIFGPVWTTLFILMGISLWLVWTAEGAKHKRHAIIVFFIQLILNVLWSVFFFGEQSPILAFVVIIALWIMILVTIVRFAGISKTAAWLLVPYILWVSFAGVLNYFIWQLNM